MEISVVLKVAGVGFLVAVACMILKGSGRDDLSVFVSLAGILIILFLLVDKIGKLFTSISDIFGI